MTKQKTASEGEDTVVIPEDQGAVQQPPRATGESVRMRVLTKGHGKIHTGEFIAGTHVPKTFNKGDEFDAPVEAADQLMDRGLADLVG